MNTNLKNITLATSILLATCKSTTTTQMKKIEPKRISPREVTTDLIKMKKAHAFDFLQSPLLLLQKLEAKNTFNKIKVPKPKKSMDVSKTKYKGSPEFLDMFLSGVLEGKGKQFCKAQEKYGVNATFLVGIANLESARGTSNIARTKNNIAGVRTSKGYLNYKSVDDCIDSLAANIRENYINEGYTTIAKINKKYSECDEWSERVVGCMDNMYHSSKSLLLNYK